MGLSNQLLAHLNVLALACYTNATLAIPHSYARAEYRVQESAWKPVPSDTLLDTGRMVSFWEQKGLRLLKVRVSVPTCAWLLALSAMRRLVIVLVAGHGQMGGWPADANTASCSAAGCWFT